MSGSFPPGPTPWPGGSNTAPPYAGLTFGQLLDRIVRLIRAHWGLYLGLALAPAGAMLGAIAVMGGLAALAIMPHIHDTARPPNFWFLLWLAPPALFLYLAAMVVYALYGAAAMYAAVRTNLGVTVSRAEAWAAARKRAGRYVWLSFLLAVIVAGPIYLVLACFAAVFGLFTAMAAHSGNATPFAFVALFPLLMPLNLAAQVYAVFMFLRYGLSIPAAVIEDLDAVAALKRGAALSRDSKGRMFVVLLMVYAANFAIVVVLEVVLFFAAAVGFFFASLVGASVHSPLILFLFVPLGLLILVPVMVALLALPYVGYATAWGVLYCDQRYRESGVLPALTDGETA